MNWCPRRELHPHLTASETVISAVGLLGHENGGLGWICTTNSALQRRMLCWLSYEAVLKWSVRLDLHQHLPGYEPDALTVKLQTNENGRIPRCCPGLLLLPRQASAAGSLVSDEKWTCAPGSHWVMRCCRPLARLFALRTLMKWFPQPDSHRHRLVHNEEC